MDLTSKVSNQHSKSRANNPSFGDSSLGHPSMMKNNLPMESMNGDIKKNKTQVF